MPSPLFPSAAALRNTFPSTTALTPPPESAKTSSRSKYPPARQELYGAWSAIDDAKAKAGQLSEQAVEELSAKAQPSGKIELYSGQYYAACTFGGLLACVSVLSSRDTRCCGLGD